MKLVRSSLAVGFFTILSRCAGFVREWLQAHFLGAGLINDAINYAISFPSFFRRIFAEGALSASFIPLFTHIMVGNGVQEARRFAESILSLLVGILSIVIILTIIFIDRIMPFILPGFVNNSEGLALTIELTRITFPFLLFISLTAFFSGMLNSIEKFTAAASSPAVGNIVIIAVLAGLTDFGVRPGESLAIGILGCGLAQFLWVFIPSQTRGVRLGFAMPHLTPAVKTFLKRIGPAALGASVIQINLIVDMALSSYLPKGSFSYLKYADRFNQLPLSVIGTAVSTTLLPILARYIEKKDHTKIQMVQNRSLEITLFFALPSMCILGFLSQEMISAFYLHGKFTAQDVIPTAQTLVAFLVGLPAYVLIKLFSTSFFAIGNTRTPVIVAICSVGLNFILNISLIWKYQQVGMALATALAAWINAGILGFLLWRSKLLKFDQKFLQFLPRALMTTCVLGGYFYFFSSFVEHFFLLYFLDWIAVLLHAALGLGFYLLLSYMMGVFSLKRIHELLGKEKNAERLS